MYLVSVRIGNRYFRNTMLYFFTVMFRMYLGTKFYALEPHKFATYNHQTGSDRVCSHNRHVLDFKLLPCSVCCMFSSG